MSPKQSAAELAAIERAAIAAELAARNIPAEVKEPKFPRSAEMVAADKARAAIGPVELTAEDATPVAKRVSRTDLANRELANWELAALAAEMKRYERTAARAARAEAKRLSDLPRLAALVRAELPAAAAEAAARAGKSEQLEYARQLAEAAAALGVSAAEAAELVSAARDYEDTAEAARPVGVTLAGPVSEADRKAAEAAKLAAAPNWSFEDMANSPAAEAGRAALAAIGPRAAGVILTNAAAKQITVARSLRVPTLAEATKRAEDLAAELTAAEDKLAAAEAAVSAAKAAKAKRPELAAEADANRIAAGVSKLAKRAALAARIAAAAEALAALELPGGIEAFIADPVASFPLAKAAEAAGVSLRPRADVMPAKFRDNGPSVKATKLVSGRGHFTMAASGISDPTGGAAAELADGYRAALAARMAAEVAAEARVTLEAVRAAAELEIEARKLAYKVRRAEAARVRRAEAAAAAKMANHGKQRKAKRAAR